jgi:hypothetical protein
MRRNRPRDAGPSSFAISIRLTREQELALRRFASDRAWSLNRAVGEAIMAATQENDPSCAPRT